MRNGPGNLSSESSSDFRVRNISVPENAPNVRNFDV